MKERESQVKRVLVTGGTGAIGFAIVRLILEKDGYEVVFTARDVTKAENALQKLKSLTGKSAVSYLIADLSRKQEIRELAQNWQGPLHVLINNAGTTPRQRLETPEGTEMQFATNVLGYFWMTQFFAPILQKSAPARIVNVASYWAGNLDLNDLEFHRRPYDNGTAYRQSKQANRMLTVSFAERLKPMGITVNACHPGEVNSHLSNQLGFGGHESPEYGAATPVWLATSKETEEVTEKWFEYLKERPCRFSTDKASIERLYAICEKY